MIDIKNYDFYNFNLKDFENDWYIFNKYEYCFFKKENDKIIIWYTNYDKNRILELFVFNKLKDWININFYDFYNVKYENWKHNIIKDLKHIEKQIKIKENYNLWYNCFSKIFKKYIWYEYTLNKLFDIENEKLYNDNYIDICNILFDKYHIQKAIEYIN